MKIANKHLTEVALTIEAFQTEEGKVTMVSGLVTENVSLGLKRRLKKIKKDVVDKVTEFENDMKELNKESETYQKDLEELLNEEVEINQEYASLEMIESIQTDKNYNFDIIELFAK